MSEILLVDKADRIVTLTLNRPERLNAVSRELRTEICNALESYWDDDSVSVFIIKGAGRAFCAGADIHHLGPRGSGKELHPGKDTIADWEYANKGQEFLFKIWDTPRPVIAQVHGYALGMGFLMMLACDLNIVAEDARLGNARMMTGGGMIGKKYMWYMTPQRAKWMDFIPGWRITGKEAVDWGISNMAVPAERLEEEVQDLARALASYPMPILKIRKKADNRVFEELGMRTSWESGMEWDTIGHKSRAGNESDDRAAKLQWKEAYDYYSDYPRRHGHG